MVRGKRRLFFLRYILAMDLDWIECDEAMDVLQQGQSKTAHWTKTLLYGSHFPCNSFESQEAEKGENTGFSRTNKSSFGPPIAWINTTQSAKGWRGGNSKSK